MTTITTVTSATGWSPDETTLDPGDAVPEALVQQVTTVATTTLDGDSPVCRVTWVDDEAADFVAEGDPIDVDTPTLSETLVATGKVAMLLKVSTEQYNQGQAAGQLANSARRAVVTKANDAFLNQTAPTPPAYTPPAGLLNVAGLTDASELNGTDLDELVDLAATLEQAGATQDGLTFVLAPTTWAELRKLKTATASNESLLGAGTSDAERRLLDIPVLVSAAVPTASGLLIDRSAIVSAVGPVRVARSEHAYFGDDSVGIRVTWRIGSKVMKADRIGKFTVPYEDES